jgi:GNAT superfamily N-acetyltransferase
MRTDEAVGTTRRTVRLDRGRTLQIRDVGRDDRSELERLYRELDDEARCLRFFSLYRPPTSFFERLTTVADRGGVGLVASLRDGAGSERIVGDGSVEALSNGDGEFALTVERRWRGWLGAYLLDTLVDAAAARGMTNLEAQILTRNRQMLALVRARGYVVIPNDDWTEVRVVIGARSEAPAWPEPRSGPRVLVEGPGSAHWDSSVDFPGDTPTVLACAGPAGHLPCPAAAGRPCELARRADLIVMLRTPDAGVWRTIRRAHPVLHAGVRVHEEAAAAAH